MSGIGPRLGLASKGLESEQVSESDVKIRSSLLEDIVGKSKYLIGE